MGTFIVSLFLLLNCSIPLHATGELTEEVSSQDFAPGRMVPCVEFEVMKIVLGICVCENDTPEQAARTIADMMKQFPESLPNLRMLPTAPSHLVEHFGNIKIKVDQLIHSQAIDQQETENILVADAIIAPLEFSGESNNSTQEDLLSLTDNQTPQAYPVQESLLKLNQPCGFYHVTHRCSHGSLITIDHPNLPSSQVVTDSLRSDAGMNQDAIIFLTHNDMSIPPNLGVGNSGTHIAQFLVPLNEIFGSAAPNMNTMLACNQPIAETPLAHLVNKSSKGTRVPAVLYDNHIKVEQFVAGEGNLLKTSILPIKHIPSRYLEVLYVMFLLTILAQYFASSLNPSGVVFARLQRYS